MTNIDFASPISDHIKRYKPSAKFGDRRDGNIASARTYFYTNEAACEKNMETFLRCIEAVAGKILQLNQFYG